ncbi:hypothetical protein WISP_51842 [Willisornis vidua]|uniref:Uncharacterized protein n=1 Tax=Willisornis vidua TaxID=1566151 RepID=A0ABQ9DIK0_9PASS|nr:hypothetical protein WISP_51842 [Willisornis vidua]
MVSVRIRNGDFLWENVIASERSEERYQMIEAATCSPDQESEFDIWPRFSDKPQYSGFIPLLLVLTLMTNFSNWPLTSFRYSLCIWKTDGYRPESMEPYPNTLTASGKYTTVTLLFDLSSSTVEDHLAFLHRTETERDPYLPGDQGDKELTSSGGHGNKFWRNL